jgi:hypothetical protein
MRNIMNTLYIDQMLGKITYEDAKERLIIQAVIAYLTSEFDSLFLDAPNEVNTPNELRDEWFDKNFNKDKNELVESLLIVPTWFGLGKLFTDFYNRILIEPWHHNHESVIDIIIQHKPESSVLFIEKAISLDLIYLHFNDTNYSSFVRKCMWALADINTPESIALLNRYRNDENEVVRQYADEQVRWLKGEKGMRYMP